MYFKALPRMIYPWKDKTGKFHGAVVPDIFLRVHLDKFFKNRQLLEDEWVEDEDGNFVKASEVKKTSKKTSKKN